MFIPPKKVSVVSDLLYCRIWYFQKYKLMENGIAIKSGSGPKDPVFLCALVELLSFLETMEQM